MFDLAASGVLLVGLVYVVARWYVARVEQSMAVDVADWTASGATTPPARPTSYGG
jgi:hypothetical protein